MITTVIAIMGCGIGGLALVLQYIFHRSDRYLLDFDFTFQNRRSSPNEAFTPILTIVVVNRGKSPIQVKEINWLNRHCDIKMKESGFEQKDTDVRCKLYDGEKDGYVALRQNQRKDFHLPFSCPPLTCNNDSYIEVVDVLDKRYEKPTGTWPDKALQATSETAARAASEGPEGFRSSRP